MKHPAIPQIFLKSFPASIWISLFLMATPPDAHADSSTFTGFLGRDPNWVGTCVAELQIGAPSNKAANATLVVICSNVINVEEFFSGNFNSAYDHYQANVTTLKNLTGMEYTQDMRLDLRRSQDGCTMSGTVTDADGPNDISFQSNTPGC